MDVDFNQTGSLYLPMCSYFYIFTLKHIFLWVISFESRELLTSTFSSKYLFLLLSSFLSFTILLGSESLKKKSWIKALDFFRKCCNSIIFMSFFKVFSSVKLMALIDIWVCKICMHCVWRSMGISLYTSGRISKCLYWIVFKMMHNY